jgi:toxin-antitoxin system PIN domain toxin
MFVVDTNILLYAANKKAPEHQICRSTLQKWRRQPSPWYLTWGIVYEFLRVVTHPRVFKSPWGLSHACGFIMALIASPTLGILQETERHLDVAAEIFESLPSLSGNILFDTHTAILMKENGIRRIYTRDTDFYRFPFIEVIDPVK